MLTSASEPGACVQDIGTARCWTPPYEEPGSLHYKMHMLLRVLRQRHDEALAPLGLNLPRLTLLTALADGNWWDQHQLAAEVSLSPSAISRGVRPLIAAGLLESGHEADRRRRPVRITRTGLSRYTRGARLFQEHESKIFGAECSTAQNRMLDETIRLLAR